MKFLNMDENFSIDDINNCPEENSETLSIDLNDLPTGDPDIVITESDLPETIVIGENDLPKEKETKEIEIKCPICQRKFEQGENIVECTKCNTPHHYECWREMGNKCSVLNCNNRNTRPFSWNTQQNKDISI